MYIEAYLTPTICPVIERRKTLLPLSAKFVPIFWPNFVLHFWGFYSVKQILCWHFSVGTCRNHARWLSHWEFCSALQLQTFAAVRFIKIIPGFVQIIICRMTTFHHTKHIELITFLILHFLNLYFFISFSWQPNNFDTFFFLPAVSSQLYTFYFSLTTHPNKPSLPSLSL